MNNTTRRAALIIIGIAIVLVLVYVAFQFFMFQRAVSALPTEGSVVTFVELGAGESYTLNDNVLERVVEEPRGDGAVITERVSSPAGEAVLFSVPGIQGMSMGILHSSGDITALVGDPTNKADLAVSANGIAVFSSSPAPLLEEVEEPTSGEEPAESSAPDEVWSVSGPTNTNVEVDFAAGFPQLVAVNLTTRAVSALGAGYAPRILSDGSIVAIAPDGVVLINSSTYARTLLMKRQMSAFPRAAISPSGTIVALPASDGTSIGFYQLAPGSTNPPQDLGVLDWRGTISFSDDEHFFVRSAQEIARYYMVPTEKLPVANPIAIISITQ